MWDRGKMYLQKAGTIILLTSVILYICNSYPVKKEFSKDYQSETSALANADIPEEEKDEKITALENEMLAEKLEYTISGRIGKFLEPVFIPIGMDWKSTTAAIAALTAKEVFVAQIGILNSEGNVDEESAGLREKLRKNYTPLQAFCIMLFCLLSIPCLATLAVIKRELNSWKMVFIEAGALFAVAYTVSFIVYQLGSWLGIGTKLL